jgi:hypothetical protein
MNVPIAICSKKNSPHLQMLLKSIENYVQNAEVYICCNDKIDSPVVKKIISNDCDTAGAAFDKILRFVFENYTEVILVNDDVVLDPDSFQLLLEDWQKLKKENVGILSARSDYCLPSHNIRFPSQNDTIAGLRWSSENDVMMASNVAPVFCMIDKNAYLKSGGFPPTNWYSDNIFCEELKNNGYTVYVSRSYVHHLGEQTEGSNHKQLHLDAMNRLKGTVWEKYVEIFNNPQQSTQVQSNQNRPRRVMLGTPSHDGKVEVVYLHSVINTIKLCAQNGIEVFPFHICYESLLQISRNDIFKTAYMSQIDDLVFVDSDQEWQPEQFLRLLMHPVDFAGCPVVKKGDAESYNIKCLKWPIPRDKNNGLLEVDSIGTGFMRLSRRAIDKMWNMSEKYDSEKDNDNRNVFETKIVDGSFYSEDVYFCKKWQDSGEKIYLDDEMTCSHVGTKKWNGNFNLWLKMLKK